MGDAIDCVYGATAHISLLDAMQTAKCADWHEDD